MTENSFIIFTRNIFNNRVIVRELLKKKIKTEKPTGLRY